MILRKIKGVHLDGHKDMSIQSPIKEYLTPAYVYLPINTGSATYVPAIEVGSKVLMGQIVANREGRFAHPVSSPVSGSYLGIKKMWHSSGKMVEMMEIQNDLEEKAIEGYGQKKITELSKETIIEAVKRAGIVGLGGAGFPTFVKYVTNSSINIILINAAECEPYITADYMLIKEQTDKLIRGIEYIMLATGANEAAIAIKRTKKPAIEALEQALIGHSNIKIALLKDVYPAGWEKYIVEKVTKKTYNGLPSEVGAIVNNVQTVIAVCEAIEESKPLIEKVVTITGEGINSPCNIKVKVGTLVSDLIPLVEGYKDPDADTLFIAGGPMTGKTIMFDNLVVSANLGSIIIKPKKFHENNPECLGCGKCAENCPAFLTPTEIRDAFLEKDIDGLRNLNTLKCVQCGLCSYVCPSRIEITEYVNKGKDLLWKSNAQK